MKKPSTLKLAMALLSLTLAAALAACPGGDSKSPAQTPAMEKFNGLGDENADRALAAALDFRNVASQNYALAIKAHGSKAAAKKFAQLNDDVFPVGDPAVGWAYFFNTSIICPVKAGGGEAVVAFHHPWSDTFLITAWKTGPDKTAVLTDAEMVMGALVRKEPALKTARLWTEKEMYPAAAAGAATSENIKAFHEAFPAGKDFKSGMAQLSDDTTIRAARIGAGKQLMDNLAELSGLFSAKPGSAGDMARDKLAEAAELAMKGDFDKIVDEAGLTEKESAKALAKMDIEAWSKYKPVSWIESGEECAVILVRGDNPDVYLTMLMKKSGKEMEMARLDVLSFQRMYELSNAKEAEVEK